MSFVQTGRALPKIKPGMSQKELNIKLDEMFRVIEEWFNDVFQAINNNAGAPEVVDTFAELPPVAEAVGRIYYCQVSGSGGKRFFASDGTNWLPLD